MLIKIRVYLQEVYVDYFWIFFFFFMENGGHSSFHLTSEKNYICSLQSLQIRLKDGKVAAGNVAVSFFISPAVCSPRKKRDFVQDSSNECLRVRWESFTSSSNTLHRDFYLTATANIAWIVYCCLTLSDE